MTELTSAQVATGAMTACVAAENVMFSQEQVIVIAQLASDISKRMALQNDGPYSPPNRSRPSLSPPPPRWFEAHSQFSRPVANYLWMGLHPTPGRPTALARNLSSTSFASTPPSSTRTSPFFPPLRLLSWNGSLTLVLGMCTPKL